VSPYVRKVKTASGATAVQIAEKRDGVRRILAHLGSAHSEAELAVLMQVARERLHAGQQAFDLGLDSASVSGDPAPGAVVVGTASQVLWEVLESAYLRLGFAAVADDAFKAMVLARIIQPTSKVAAIEVLEELGVPAPHRNTLAAALKRCITRDYSNILAKACLGYSASTSAGRASLVLYDCTTLYFETENEDDLRKVGMSKERRVDPQIQVGLLVDPAGFPLEVHCFEENKAECPHPHSGLVGVPGLARGDRHDRGRRCRDAVRGKPERLGGPPGSASSSGRGSPRPPTTWPSTSTGTATTSPTGRSSNRAG
jgi:hypothetical protein